MTGDEADGERTMRMLAAAAAGVAATAAAAGIMRWSSACAATSWSGAWRSWWAAFGWAFAVVCWDGVSDSGGMQLMLGVCRAVYFDHLRDTMMQ